jgi:hypothetical protein
MKSAYGRLTPAPDYELTCVEPGSPMGELMRRYWQPVCTSDELHDLPRKEKLLCEEIVVFRDKKGRVGALDPHCAHRGTSLVCLGLTRHVDALALLVVEPAVIAAAQPLLLDAAPLRRLARPRNGSALPGPRPRCHHRLPNRDCGHS